MNKRELGWYWVSEVEKPTEDDWYPCLFTHFGFQDPNCTTYRKIIPEDRFCHIQKIRLPKIAPKIP